MALCRSFGKEQMALCCSFCKERKSDSLFVALLKRGNEQFALCYSFGKEQKSELLIVALFIKSDREKSERAKEQKSDCPTLTLSQ